MDEMTPEREARIRATVRLAYQEKRAIEERERASQHAKHIAVHRRMKEFHARKRMEHEQRWAAISEQMKDHSARLAIYHELRKQELKDHTWKVHSSEEQQAAMAAIPADIVDAYRQVSEGFS